jgi:hypothetical protein
MSETGVTDVGAIRVLHVDVLIWYVRHRALRLAVEVASVM